MLQKVANMNWQVMGCLDNLQNITSILYGNNLMLMRLHEQQVGDISKATVRRPAQKVWTNAAKFKEPPHLLNGFQVSSVLKHTEIVHAK